MALLSSSGDRAAAEAAYAAEEERRRREGIPSFDVGTNYVPRDMIAQIHEGERIIPAADNTRLMALLANANQGGQNDALVAEVKALRAEVTALRAERTAADVPLHRMVVAPSLTPDSYTLAQLLDHLHQGCSSLSHPG